MSEILYSPSDDDLKHSHIVRFMQFINARHQLKIDGYEQCHQWSIHHKAEFWLAVADYCGLDFISTQETVVKHEQEFLQSTWFDSFRLNYAQHLLTNTSDDIAIFFKAEDQIERELSFKNLNQQVSVVQQFYQQLGIKKGDVIAAYLPNMPEAVVCMLAASSIGAIWSSCSPDFGAQGVIDRFGQINPVLFIAASHYYYNGKQHQCAENSAEIMRAIPSIAHHLLIQFDSLDVEAKHSKTVKTTDYTSLLKMFCVQRCTFEPLDFNHPLFIMYSSGTTGVPKCIVHGAGGTLIQHLKEHQLHSDFKPKDVVFYFTTCGWMMWNWLASSLASGCSIALYDGSPFYPNAHVLWQWLDRLNVAHFGTSAKYIDALNNQKINVQTRYTLRHLRSVLSTGSPLVDESYDYVYQFIKNDVRLVSMSGGTDILSCFALGVPIKPIIKGQLQCLGLGMDVVVIDDNNEKVSLKKGELCCQSSFPSKPLYFWHDENNKKYKDAYFNQLDNMWCHGDFAEITAERGLIIYGRSDATLNPCGVRIGTAEIYRPVEQFEEIKESIVVGQAWQGDVRIVLFIALNQGYVFNQQLVKKIKTHIRVQTTPRHVPAVILEVGEIPRTKNGKIVELAVAKMIAGEKIANIQSLANPHALADFKNRAELNA